MFPRNAFSSSIPALLERLGLSGVGNPAILPANELTLLGVIAAREAQLSNAIEQYKDIQNRNAVLEVQANIDDRIINASLGKLAEIALAVERLQDKALMYSKKCLSLEYELAEVCDELAKSEDKLARVNAVMNGNACKSDVSEPGEGAAGLH